ncbi:MAG: helix-turn-helix transcriptional regulator [Lachnospiraceae bacterium]|nr:helix-turn-helix transcriptional regulator [Lachnospiraceae bacterium]
MDENFIRNRLTQLRMQKEVSEYKMSLDLGHSKSYIQSIVSGRAMPSMSEFLYICEYLGVTPREFFDTDTENPVLLEQVTDALKSLSTSDLALVMELIERLSKDL